MVNGDDLAMKILMFMFYPPLRRGLPDSSCSLNTIQRDTFRWQIVQKKVGIKLLPWYWSDVVNSDDLVMKILIFMFYPPLCRGLPDSLRTFYVTLQAKRRILSLRKNVTWFFTKPTCPPRKPAFGRLSRLAALEKSQKTHFFCFLNNFWPYTLPKFPKIQRV